MSGFRYRFKERGADKPLRTPGIDWGWRGLYIVEDYGSHLILKNPGHTGWAGIGQVDYYPSRYFIVKVVSWDSEYTTVEIVHSFEPGRKWRSCIAHAREIIDTIIKENHDGESNPARS
jgi:hypothetical protein